MIISASRRTDIPAFYSNWFFNRLKEGFVFVQNPFYLNQVRKIELNSDAVDCIVFWTKNPEPMLEQLHHLKSYPYYFLFTITGFEQDMELNVPQKIKVIETFIKLSEKIGKEKIIWRYDPIFFTDKYNVNHHYKYFEYVAQKLKGYTKTCIISFLTLYKKCERNLHSIHLQNIDENEKHQFCKNLVDIAQRYYIKIQSCATEMDLSDIGIEHGQCIDDRLIEQMIGHKLNVDRDKNQRPACGCVKSIDIGAYNTCAHGCLYCYANYDYKLAQKNYHAHDKQSTIL